VLSGFSLEDAESVLVRGKEAFPLEKRNVQEMSLTWNMHSSLIKRNAQIVHHTAPRPVVLSGVSMIR